MSNLKTFILQHEIITPGYENHVIKAGTIIRETLQKTANGNVIFRADNGDIFTDTYVIDNPLWFKPEKISMNEGVLYGASKSEFPRKEGVGIEFDDLFFLKNGEFIPARIDQSPISKYNYIWKLEDRHQPKKDINPCEVPQKPISGCPILDDEVLKNIKPENLCSGLFSVLKELNKKQKVEEPEAVRFAKWVSPHTHIFGKGWYLPCENQQYFTTEELYSKFKQETK